MSTLTSTIPQISETSEASSTQGFVGGVSFRPARLPSSAVFDPVQHLAYHLPPKQHTMKELHLADEGISDIAVTDPFPLYTREAVVELRRDVLSDKVLNEYRVSSHLAKNQAREYNKLVAPFTCAAWSSPEVTRAVSEAAGMELVPIMTLELGHTNFQVQGDDLRSIYPEPSRPYGPLTAEQQADFEARDLGNGVVDWHYDAYPFVCVVMLSDVTNMIGGETAVMMGDGNIRKVRGPGIGNAVVLQGRHVKHLACSAWNAPERITMVTSYRAKDPLVRDASILDTIRIVSQQDRLNYQWSLYRMKLLAERFAKYAEGLEKKRGHLADDYFPRVLTKEDMQKFADEQIAYLQTTYQEMM